MNFKIDNFLARKLHKRLFMLLDQQKKNNSKKVDKI